MSSPIRGIDSNDSSANTGEQLTRKRKRKGTPINARLNVSGILNTDRRRTPVQREGFVLYFSSDDEAKEAAKPIKKKRTVSQITPSTDEDEIVFESEKELSEPDFYFQSGDEDGLMITANSRAPELPPSDERDEEIEEVTTAGEDFENGNYWDPDQTGGAKDKSYSKSAEFYRQAAEKLHPIALFRLGIFHDTGVEGCPGGVKEAAKFYEEAGNADVAAGWNNLGALYLNQKLEVEDYRERAFACFTKAINCTTICPSAHNNLGLCLEQGLGVDKDFDLARYHYHIGAEGGDPDAQYSLGIQYENGRGQDRDEIFGVGIRQSDESAKYWYQRSLQNPQNTGVEWAQYALGKLGLKGRIAGVDPDDKRVINLIKQAAKEKFTPAMIRYAKIKEDREKPEKAFSLLKEATQVDPESRKAKYQLALCYLNGTGTEQNIELGLKLLNEAVDAKYCLIKQKDWNQINHMISPHDSFALLMKMKDTHPDVGQIHYELALRYFEEAGIPRSIKTGVQYFDKAVALNNCAFDTNRVLSVIEQAAKEKDLEASFELANITLKGELGVDASADKAIKILSQAVLDHPECGEAKYQLALYYFEGIGTLRDIKKVSVLLKDAKINGFEIKQKELLEKFNALKTKADETNEPKTLLETARCLEAGLGEREEALKYCRQIIEIAQGTNNKSVLTEATDILYQIGNDLIDCPEQERIKEGIKLLKEASKLGNEKAIKVLTKLASDRIQSLQRDAQTNDSEALMRLAELAGQQLNL